MSNIIVDPGVIPVSFLKEAIEESNYTTYLIGYEVDHIRINSEWNNIGGTPFHYYSSFAKTREPKHIEAVADNYNRVFNIIVSDYRTMQIAERAPFRVKPWENDFNDLIKISNLVTNFLDWVIELKPSFLFFQLTPHEIGSWVLGMVCEAMGIPVYMTRYSPLQWKAYLIKGIDQHQMVSCNYGEETGKNEDYVKRYYDLNKEDFAKALTPLEKKNLKARGGKFWSWRKELQESLRRPHRIVAMFRKYSLYKLYQSLSVKEFDEEPYIAVFLHFQPERTSLPEGRFFTQQLHMIRTLHFAMPKIKIYVKEHPSMLTGHFDIRYRNMDFYKAVSLLDNVRLVSIDMDTFYMLDHSLCIATITGTVGVQALIRGKEVLCFGPAPCSLLTGSHTITNVQDARKVVSEILNNKDNPAYNLPQIVLKELYRIDEITASGIIGDTTPQDLYDGQYLFQSAGIVFKHLLTSYLSK